MGVLHGTTLNLLISDCVAPVAERSCVLTFAASMLMENFSFYRDIKKLLVKEDPSAAYVTTLVQDEVTSD
jgi:hypothetical protein